MGSKKVVVRDPGLLRRKLRDLRARRDALESLIQALENYAKWLAQGCGPKSS